VSTIKVNAITDANGGSTAKLYGVSMRDGGTGWVNRIINGGMVIDQRNAGASVTPTNGQYLVDRFKAYLTQASKYTAQQNAGSVTPPSGFRNYLGATSSSAYSVVSGDYFGLVQPVEGFNIADLGWGTASAQTITVSFWVRSSLTGTFGGALASDGSANRSYPFTYTISAANTWEQKTLTIAGDTTGAWLSTNGLGVEVRFGLGAGSTWSGTAGAWVTGNLVSATGATSVVGTNGATFYITGVQLEAGSVASPFERRDYGRELMMCQRYYQVFDGGSFVFAGRSSSTTAVIYGVPLQAAMRASPTVNNPNIITYGPTNSAPSGGANTVITFGTNSMTIQTTGYSGLTDDRGYNGYVSTASLTLNSEL
jgi:hypothetical protein